MEKEEWQLIGTTQITRDSAAHTFKKLLVLDTFASMASFSLKRTSPNGLYHITWSTSDGRRMGVSTRMAQSERELEVHGSGISEQLR
jgi:hypothetical protein